MSDDKRIEQYAFARVALGLWLLLGLVGSGASVLIGLWLGAEALLSGSLWASLMLAAPPVIGGVAGAVVVIVVAQLLQAYLDMATHVQYQSSAMASILRKVGDLSRTR